MAARIPDRNTLFYGDNLRILREHIEDESVDLIYLDPPFNSNASYNVLFKSPAGEQSAAQIEAFDDTWHWNIKAEEAFDEVMQSGNSEAAEMLRSIRQFLGENDMMAYLAMMAVRLIELHRVLKPSGSLYLHCDPTASHYLKILLDAVFDAQHYVNEIIWQRTNTKAHAFTRFSSSHDVIFYYRKGEEYTWNAQYISHSEKYLKSHYSSIEEKTGRRYTLGDCTNPNPNRPNLTYEWKGVTKVWRWTKEKMQAMHDQGRLVYTKSGSPRYKRYLDEMKGTPLNTVWTDIPPLNSQAQERLGYPTQKPLALMERIIEASSNPGDVVLDPFCGCGTTVHAAQKLERRWLGIDVTHLAIGLIQKRLTDAFPMVQYDVVGVPKDIGAAQALADADKYEFQKWALSLVEAQPYKGGKKGADGGVDGYVFFKPDGKTTEKAIVSVKGGASVGDTMVKDLITTVEHEKAMMGIFITLAKPTKPMITRAATAGFYKTDYGSFPKIQILTIEQLLSGERPHMPWLDPTAFKKAKREDASDRNQGKLL
jgi:site-specific DNA-methyltransferase (adenine-specific)